MPIDLDTVAERVANHDGIIWTEVVSLRREDAERLHFNNAEAWKNLVRRNINEIAKAHRIKVEDLEWYGAFHNTTHHPHIHLIIFSKGQEGFLSEKGIKELCRSLGQGIFRDEQYKLATIETGYRNQLKEQLADLLQQLQTRQSVNFNAQIAVNTARIGYLFSMLAKQIVSSAGKRLDELNKMMPLPDSKERDKIREKKLAHGLKEGADSSGVNEEVYDSQAAEGILPMLDYLILLGNQDSSQDAQEEPVSSENEYDFDNAYAEYLNDTDDGLYEDDTDDEDEYYGMSM
jgi:hypothetical protein